MERLAALQAGMGASALSVKTKFPLGQDGKRVANQDCLGVDRRGARVSGFEIVKGVSAI